MRAAAHVAGRDGPRCTGAALLLWQSQQNARVIAHPIPDAPAAEEVVECSSGNFSTIAREDPAGYLAHCAYARVVL